MSKRKPRPKPILSRPEFVFVRLCLLVALAISIYLGWTSLQGGPIPGCGPDSDCDKVLASRWAYILGLPVSLLAAPLYAALLGLLWPKDLKWRPIIAGSVIILFAAAWFVGVQFFALRAFCKFCMTAHIAGIIAATILLRRNPLATRPSFAWSAVGAAAVALMVTGQFLSTPAGPEITRYAETPRAGSETPSLSDSPATAEDPTFSILGGQFVLNLTEVPVHGNLHAPRKVVKLFDYTCHHCRDMHHHFQPVLESYSNQLAVVSLPMPLDASCNHIMKQTPRAHVNACEYAKLGLAVFYASPGSVPAFDEWIFAPPRPPSLQEAHRFAASLVGTQALSAALIDPRIERQIQQDISIYLTNSRTAGSAKMPQLLFTEGTTIGASTSVADLLGILVKAVGLDTNAPASPAH